jgi:hypothetical protein
MHLLVAQKLQDFKTKDNKTVIVSEYYITHWIKRQTFRIDALNDIICGPKIESHYANRAYLSTTMNVGIIARSKATKQSGFFLIGDCFRLAHSGCPAVFLRTRPHFCKPLFFKSFQ